MAMETGNRMRDKKMRIIIIDGVGVREMVSELLY